MLLDIPNGYRGYHTDKALCFSTVPSKHPQSKLIRAAREQCVFLENEAAAMLLRPGSVPSARYMASCAPALIFAFRAGFMSGCRFFGHWIGLTRTNRPSRRGFDEPIRRRYDVRGRAKDRPEGVGLVGCEKHLRGRSDGPARSLTAGACDTPFEING